MMNSFTFCENNNNMAEDENISSFTFSFKDQEGIETPDVVWHRLEKIQNSVKSQNETRINQWYGIAAQQHLGVVLTRTSNNNDDKDGDDLEILPSSQDSSVVASSQPNVVEDNIINHQNKFPQRRQQQQQNVEITNSVLLTDEVFSSHHVNKNHHSFSAPSQHHQQPTFPSNVSNSLHPQQIPVNVRPLGFWNFPNVVEFIDALSPYFPPMTSIPPQFFELLLRDAEEYTNFCFEARKKQQQQHLQHVFTVQQLRQKKSSQAAPSTTNCLWSSKFPVPSQYSSLHASTNRREVFLQFKSWLESYVPDEELKRKFGIRRSHRHGDDKNINNSRRRQRENCDKEDGDEEEALNVTANIMTMKIIGNNRKTKSHANNSTKNAKNVQVNAKHEDAALEANESSNPKSKEETELEIYQDILGIGNSSNKDRQANNNNNAFLGSNGKPIPGILGLPLSITSQDSASSSSPNFLSLANRKFPSMLMMVTKPTKNHHDPNPNKIFDNPNNEFRGSGINEMTGQRVSARILEQETLLRKKQEAAERKRRRQKGYFPNFERQLKREFVPGEAVGASGDVTNVVVLCGATGIGTTQFVAQLAQHFDVDVVECNPSMRRNAASLEKLISEATQAKQIKKNNSSSSSNNNNDQQQNSDDNNSGKIQNQNSFFNINSLQTPSTFTTSTANSALSKLDQMFQENKRRKELEEKAIQEKKDAQQQENSKKKSATTKTTQSDISKFFSSRSADSNSTTASSSVAPSDKSTIVGVVDVDAASSPILVSETKRKYEKKTAPNPPTSNNNNSTAPTGKKSCAKSSSSPASAPAVPPPPPPAPKKSFFNVPTPTVAISSKRNPQPFPSNVDDAADQKNTIETSKTHEYDDDDDVLLLLSASNEETSSASSLSPITISSCSQTSSNSSDLMEMLPPPPAASTTTTTISSSSTSENVAPKPAAKPRGRPKKVETVLHEDAAPQVPVAAKKTAVSAPAAAPGKKPGSKKTTSGTVTSHRKQKSSSSSSDSDDASSSSSSNSSSSSSSNSSSDFDSDAGNSFLQHSNLEASGKGLYSIVLVEGGDIVCNDEGGFHAALRRLTQDARCPVIVTANPANSPETLAASLGCPIVFLDSVSTIHQALATGLMISQVNATRNKSGKTTKLFEAASSLNGMVVSPLSPNFSSCSPNSSPTSPFSYESNNNNNNNNNINLNGKTRFSSAVQSQTLRGIVNALVCFSVLSAEIEIAKIGAIEMNLMTKQMQKSNNNNNTRNISCGMSQDAAIEIFDLSPIVKNNSNHSQENVPPPGAKDEEEKMISFLNNSASRKRGLPQEKVKCVLVNLVRWLRRREVLLSNNNGSNKDNNIASITASSNHANVPNAFPSAPSSSPSAGVSSSLDVRKMLNDLQWVTLPALKSDNFNFFVDAMMSNTKEENSSNKILIDAHEIDSRIGKICHDLGSVLHSGDKTNNNVLEINDNEGEKDDDDDDDSTSLPSCLLKFASILEMNHLEILSDRFFVSQEAGLDEYSIWEENRRKLKQLETSFVNVTSATNSTNNNNNNNNNQANKNVTNTANNVGKASVTFAAFFSGGGNKNLAAVNPPPLPQPSATSTATNSNASVNNIAPIENNNGNNVSSSSSNNNNTNGSHNNSSTVIRIRPESEMNKRFGNMRSAKWAKEYYGTRGHHAVNDVASYFNFLRRK